MSSPRAKGHMILKSISDSDGFASLSPKAAVLFAMLIPHFNAYGKMNGGPGYVKDEVCPKVKYLKSGTIPGLLREISQKTSVKWFQSGGRWWIHSLNFLKEHQKLRLDRMGHDILPDYSRTTPGLCRHEVQEQVQEQEQVQGDSRTTPVNPKKNPDDIPFSEILEDFNNLAGTKYKTDPVTGEIQKLIRARWKEGFTLEDFQKVHRNMVAKWKDDPRMKEWLRPFTLYTEKFQGYLHSKPPMTAEEEKKRTAYKQRLRDYTEKRQKAQKAYESCPDEHPQKEALKQRVEDYDKSITKLESYLNGK